MNLAHESFSFSLIVDRYEFPDEELGPTEDNPAGEDFDPSRFLVVTVSVSTPEGSWQATAPEMTTSELERFADWLEEISQGKRLRMGVYFTERDIEFVVDEECKILTVYLYCDFLPPWMERSQDLALEFPLQAVDLGGAIASIRRQLEEFPGRPTP